MNRTNKTIAKLEKQHDKQYDKLTKCQEIKCNKMYKEKDKEDKKFTKIQDKVCTQKNSDKYYDCTVKLYEGSKLEALRKKFTACAITKCIKEKNALKKINTSIDAFYIKHPELWIKKIQEFQKFKLNK